MPKYYKPVVFILVILLSLAFFSQSTNADGLIIVTPPISSISSYPLEVRYHHVDVKINGQTAVTSVDQEFYNPADQRLEGVYLFPVPKGAVIKKFSMFIDGKEMAAELLDATKARQIYEDIVRKQLDPALLEYSGQDLFKIRVFPIEPHAIKRVKLSYQEVLAQDNGTFEYIYPLNTEKFSAKNLGDLTINVDLQTTANLKNIYCPTHMIETVRRGEHNAIVGFKAQNVKPDTDFKLYFNTDNSKIGFSLAVYRSSGAGSEGYFLMDIAPDFVINEPEVNAKDITFVLDNSGSMNGAKLEQAKQALLFCLNNLNKNDRFQLIRFSTEAEALFNGLKEVAPGNLQTAREFIHNLNAIGGTNIEEALQLALSGLNNTGRPHFIIFITDGKPTVGELNEDALLDKIKAKNNSHTRIFTFGIGSDLNTHLLDKITELTRAYRTYITPQEDIEVKISNFYTKVQSPVLTDLKLNINGNVKLLKMYPQDPPDLFKGSNLMILGQYQGDGKAQIRLSGKVANKQQDFQFQAGFPKSNPENDFIPALWATRRVGALLDKIRLYGESKELVDEITDLARKYGIITPYTSYLILEDEQNRLYRNDLTPEQLTLGNIPGADTLATQNKTEYSAMPQESGSGSVQTSKELQALNDATNAADKNQGQSRLEYKDKQGQTQNLTQNVKYLQGRAFYNNSEWWVDSMVQSLKTSGKIRIKFAGQAYFDLLKAIPKVSELLALGKNVRFVWGKQVYEVYEK
jgi:Ca-activated chloride channel family protein